VCLTDKDHFIEFGKHSGMVNTKFKHKLPVYSLKRQTLKVFLLNSTSLSVFQYGHPWEHDKYWNGIRLLSMCFERCCGLPKPHRPVRGFQLGKIGAFDLFDDVVTLTPQGKKPSAVNSVQLEDQALGYLLNHSSSTVWLRWIISSSTWQKLLLLSCVLRYFSLS
jgi:hypothetical protein